MRIFLTGVSCVGKTTVGKKLAAMLSCTFFDLDQEIEAFFGAPIERLQNRFLTMNAFRNEACKALRSLLQRTESQSCVIALPPSGLMNPYWRLVKNTRGTIITSTDTPSNILQRIRFYDIDSRLIEKHLTDKEKTYWLSQIRKDIAYFGKTFKRAHRIIDISGLNVDQATAKVKTCLESIQSEKARLQ